MISKSSVCVCIICAHDFFYASLKAYLETIPKSGISGHRYVSVSYRR